jgi:hypothetical protein
MRNKRDTQILSVGRIYSNSVRISQETHSVSATKPNRLMLFRETCPVYCENHMEHTNTLRGQKVHYLNIRAYGKGIPVTGRGGPYGCETSRLPHFLDSRLTDSGEAVSLTRRPPFILRKIPSTHLC